MISSTLLLASLLLTAATPTLSSPIIPNATRRSCPSVTETPDDPTSSQLAQSACTTTITDTDWKCPGMTATAYPETTTSTTAIPCGNGCADIEVALPLLMCPAVMPFTTISASENLTIWSTICANANQQPSSSSLIPTTSTQPAAISASTTDISAAPSSPPPPSPPRIARRHGAMERRSPQDLTQSSSASISEAESESVPSDCMTTFHEMPQVTSAPEYTWFDAITKVTSALPCGGCELVLEEELLGPAGPQHSYSSTITMPVMTSTVYTCM